MTEWTCCKGVDINSRTSFDVKPQELNITPCLYDSIFNGNSSYNGMYQKVTSNKFSIQNFGTLLTAIVIGNLRVSPTATVNYYYEGLDSKLLPLPTPDSYSVSDNLRNNTYFSNFEGGVGADLSYENHPITINMYIPYAFHSNRLHQKAQGQDLYRKDLSLEVESRVLWDISPHMTWTSHYNLSHSYPTVSTLYGGYIISDYRTLSRYNANLQPGKSHYADTKLECNNLLNIKKYITSSIDDMTKYYSEYNIRRRSVLLTASFKVL